VSASRAVCILTSGKGTRMGPYANYINKGLLPLDKKAVLSHIIDRCPPDTDFVIGLGFLGEQVRNYLKLAHPDRIFEFVEIENYSGPGSGPGYSLLCCADRLQRPFYFVSCDTLWDNELNWTDVKDNWVGVAQVRPEETGQYCNMGVTGGVVDEVRDKVFVADPRFRAFVGLCFIRDYRVFWTALESKDTVAGEHQISNGLRALVRDGTVRARDILWTDVGDLERYTRAVRKYENYDFSKQDEALYILDGRVIKFFRSPETVDKRVRRSQLNAPVFPKVTGQAGQFYCYEFWPGRTLYQSNNQTVFAALLEWLGENLWMPATVDRTTMYETCRRFYYDKTLERLDRYYEKYAMADGGSQVNGVPIPPTNDLLARVRWEEIFDGVPVFFHGDLQFDNILYDEKRRDFLLLDWRDDFGGHLEFGDLYYDLAKLYGGIVLNYDYIKQNLFSYQEDGGGIWFDFAQRYHARGYLDVLTRYIDARGLQLDRVRVLVALIYLNMAPLHHHPFDKMLYSLGREILFREVDKDSLR
jgi:NDP-sugar pyrophosphorylase family protein